MENFRIYRKPLRAMICHLILLMVETDEGFNSPLPLKSIKVAGNNFQYFSNFQQLYFDRSILPLYS